jgi:hypothetical protein
MATIQTQATPVVIRKPQTNGKAQALTIEQELALLRAENAKLMAAAQAQATTKLSLKVSEKGCISVIGLGRFPLSLYRSQMERFLAFAKTGAIEEFIQANASKLPVRE